MNNDLPLLVNGWATRKRPFSLHIFNLEFEIVSVLITFMDSFLEYNPESLSIILQLNIIRGVERRVHED